MLDMLVLDAPPDGNAALGRDDEKMELRFEPAPGGFLIGGGGMLKSCIGGGGGRNVGGAGGKGCAEEGDVDEVMLDGSVLVQGLTCGGLGTDIVDIELV
jgi:hypothetical protein